MIRNKHLSTTEVLITTHLHTALWIIAKYKYVNHMMNSERFLFLRMPVINKGAIVLTTIIRASDLELSSEDFEIYELFLSEAKLSDDY